MQASWLVSQAGRGSVQEIPDLQGIIWGENGDIEVRFSL
jgi:hypothetical protein